jgi:hypothetical protein
VNNEELYVDRTATAVGMTGVRDSLADVGGDTQFLIELAPQSLLGGLASLHFAPGKLPFQGHRLVGPPLTDQNLLIPQDKRGNDEPNYLHLSS